jgi:TonB family protein
MSKEPARQSEEEIVKQIWDNARKKARADAEEAARVATLEKERVAAEQKARKAAEIAGARRPRPLSQPQIGFPKDLSEKGLSQGWAIVSFTVETDGQVRTARAVRSSHPEFAAAAVDGVRKWLFQPGQREGRTVPWQMEVPVIFNPLPAETPKRR